MGPTWASHVILSPLFFLLSPHLPLFNSLPSPLSRRRGSGARRRVAAEARLRQLWAEVERAAEGGPGCGGRRDELGVGAHATASFIDLAVAGDLPPKSAAMPPVVTH
jgi:hypothetical protein